MIACAAVVGSGIVVHSTRSKFAIFGPDVQSVVPPARGTYPANFSYTTFAPGTRSSALNRYGPLPTISVTCVNGSVLAIRSGMITGRNPGVFANAAGSSANGRFNRNTSVLSSFADNSSVAAISAPPNASRLPHRCTLATQSRARTGSPSWNFKPSRRVSVQVLPSFSVVNPSSICGLGRYCPSCPNSVS